MRLLPRAQRCLGEKMTTMLKVINKAKLRHNQTVLKCLFATLLLGISVVGFSKPTSNKYAAASPLLHYTKPAPKITHPARETKSIKGMNPKVFQLALKAHQKAQSMGVAKKSVVTIIDYSLPSTTRRMWVVDMSKQKVLYHTLVAHGSGSGGNTAQRFSDIPGSLQTSLGVFVTGSTYQGKHGLSLTLHGLEKGINGNAERRRIVIHGAHYVNEGMAGSLGRLGRSWGCPALDQKISTPVINTIKNGSMVFAYYPDNNWIKRSKFL